MSANQVQTLRRVTEQLPDRAALLDLASMKPAGTWQTATVPATLDLAERAAQAVNVLTASLKPEHAYAVTQSFRFDTQPPFDASPNWMPMKFVRALPLMRTMCGSIKNLEIEHAVMAAILQQVADDGQLYFPISADGPPASTAYPVMSGIAVLALLTWYGRDHNPAWLDWAKVMVEGLKAAMIQLDDYAYIPPECSLSRDGRWHWTLRGGGQWPPGYTPYVPPAEPTSDQQGFEGAVKWEQSNVIKALVRAYKVLGDEDALAQARKLARFCLKPTLWEPVDDNGHPGVEHGVWAGHLHGNLNALSALLDLAVATSESHLKQLVRQGYEHARRHGVIRLGWMPSWIAPQRFGRPASAAIESEGCGIADTLMLAVQLTDAGLGDYWDDVDAIVRNHLLELQMVDLAAMRCACGNAAYDATLQRFVGGFTQAVLTANLRSAIYGCCTGNGTRSLYYAWEGITRFHQGVATVNLWLNRAATWLDIDSYLPYEGKVVLHNKQAHTLFVRIPYWVDRQALCCLVNNRRITAGYTGNFLLFQDMQPGDTIQLDFPVPEAIEHYTIGKDRYTVTLRGSTVVDLQPRATDDDANRNKVPFFVRDHLRETVAPLQMVQRFTPEQVLPAD
jgi:hypothetical protein